MNKILLAVLLLCLSSLSWADDIPPEDLEFLKQYTEKPAAQFVLPQIQEFYVPITPVSTVIGAVFGSVKRQNKQIQDYWLNRKAELDQENQQCLALDAESEIKGCLANVRQTEIRKSEVIQQYNQQRLQTQFAQSAYMMQALQSQRRNPVTTNCSSYGSGYRLQTDCTSY